MKVNIHRLMAGIALGFVLVFFYKTIVERNYYDLAVLNVYSVSFLTISLIMSLAGFLEYFPKILPIRVFFILISAILLPLWGTAFLIIFNAVIEKDIPLLYGVHLAGSLAICWTDLRLLSRSVFRKEVNLWNIWLMVTPQTKKIALSIIGVLLLILVGIFGIIDFAAVKIIDGGDYHIAGLKTLTAQEAVWRQRDIDGNGIKDYWTYDVSAFYRMYQPDGTKANLIDIELARTDATFSPTFTTSNFFGYPLLEDWFVRREKNLPVAQDGYLFRAMLLDESGIPYNQNPVGKNDIKACNPTKFAFVAYPEKYGMTGINTFIVNQSGTVYSNDCGSDDRKIVLQWPAATPDGSPTAVIGPGGRRWAPAE
ncbi:MAG: DUF2950 family protein [Planctomycetes bacterium]|nr:DUF2950 family protein [Planctomycetota bacterium]